MSSSSGAAMPAIDGAEQTTTPDALLKQEIKDTVISLQSLPSSGVRGGTTAADRQRSKSTDLQLADRLKLQSIQGSFVDGSNNGVGNPNQGFIQYPRSRSGSQPSLHNSTSLPSFGGSPGGASHGTGVGGVSGGMGSRNLRRHRPPATMVGMSDHLEKGDKGESRDGVGTSTGGGIKADSSNGDTSGTRVCAGVGAGAGAGTELPMASHDLVRDTFSAPAAAPNMSSVDQDKARGTREGGGGGGKPKGISFSNNVTQFPPAGVNGPITVKPLTSSTEKRLHAAPPPPSSSSSSSASASLTAKQGSAGDEEDAGTEAADVGEESAESNETDKAIENDRILQERLQQAKALSRNERNEGAVCHKFSLWSTPPGPSGLAGGSSGGAGGPSAPGKPPAMLGPLQGATTELSERGPSDAQPKRSTRLPDVLPQLRGSEGDTGAGCVGDVGLSDPHQAEPEEFMQETALATGAVAPGAAGSSSSSSSSSSSNLNLGGSGGRGRLASNLRDMVRVNKAKDYPITPTIGGSSSGNSGDGYVMWESTDAIAGSPERYGGGGGGGSSGGGIYGQGLGLGIQTSLDSLDSNGADAVLPVEEMGVLTYASIASCATASGAAEAGGMDRRVRGDFSTNTTPTVAQLAGGGGGGGGGGSFQEVEEEVEEDEELRNIGAVRAEVTGSANSSLAPNLLTMHTGPFPFEGDGGGDDATYHTRDTHSPALSEMSGGDGDLSPQPDRPEPNPFSNNNNNNNNNNTGAHTPTHTDSGGGGGGGGGGNPFARAQPDTNPFASTQPSASNNPISNDATDAAMHMQQPAYNADDVDPMAATLKSGVGTANPFANPHYQRSALERGAHKEDMQQQQQQQSEMTPKAMGGDGSGGGGGTGDLDLLTHAHEQQEEAPMAWIKGELIGEGTFGSVYKGMVQATGELIGIKQLGFVDGSSSEIESLRREIDVMWKLDHPNIVRYLGTDRSDRYFYILLEYVPGGSIASMLSQYGPFSEDLVRRFSYQILRGLAYLHKVGIVHRDIKGANVLVSSEGVAKVADFGCSKQLLGLCTSSLEESLKAIRGSVPWMAPEVYVHTHWHTLMNTHHTTHSHTHTLTPITRTPYTTYTHTIYTHTIYTRLSSRVGTAGRLMCGVWVRL